MTESKQPQKGRIFISYRRIDSEGYAGRIYDRLAPHFGDNAIFMDVDDIPAGVDFVKYLENEVQSCDVLIALIGKQWLHVKDEHGTRRLDDPNDFVRIEIATALQRDIRVIPVLLGGAQMPKVSDLPENLQPLTRRNGVLVNHHSFHADITRLIKQLEIALDAVENERQRIAREKADREAAEKAAKEKAEREAAREKARVEAEELARQKAERKKVERKPAVKPTVIEEKSVKRVSQVEPKPIETKAVLRKPGMQVAFWGIGFIVVIFVIGWVFNNADKPTAPVPTSTKTQTIETVINPTKSFTSTPAKTSTPVPTVLPTEITDAKGITMRLVPEGEFTMGSEKYDDEKPIHQVYLDAFYMDIYEVTNAAYEACVTARGCEPPQSTSHYDDSKYENHPVVYVDWNQAQTYCAWRDASLPTEAQWEKAARSDDGRTYPWGEGISCSQANYYDGNKYCVGNTTEVGSYESGKSPYGMYDMAGNVWEWVNDWYSETYSSISQSSNPLGPDSGQYRVLRGGSWNFSDDVVRSALRGRNTPDLISFNVGFRCARSLP